MISDFVTGPWSYIDQDVKARNKDYYTSGVTVLLERRGN